MSAGTGVNYEILSATGEAVTCRLLAHTTASCNMRAHTVHLAPASVCHVLLRICSTD
jgi:hypothetical protein